MASTSSAATSFGSQSLSASKANDSEERAEIEKARRNQSAFMIGSAVLRLTKLCAPKCLDYQQVQVTKAEKVCLDNCVKNLHNVNEATMHFFRDFESDSADKQRELIRDLQDEVVQEKSEAKKVAKEQRKREAGYVRM